MKKIVTLFLCAAIACTASAREKKVSDLHKKATITLQPSHRGNADDSTISISPPSFFYGSPCAGTLGIYNTPAGNHIAGTNSYGDKEVLMKYALSAYNTALPTELDSVFALFGKPHILGNGMLRAKIYSVGLDGGPGNVLATSEEIPVSKIDTLLSTSFGFTPAFSMVSDTFFISIDFSSLYATGDSVALITTSPNCDSAGVNNAWSKISDNNFFPFSDSLNNWGARYDVAIFATVKENPIFIPPTSIFTVKKQFFEAFAYPVPANNQLMVSFEGQSPETIKLTLMDITGKELNNMLVATEKGKNYRTNFDVSALSRGFYFIELQGKSHKQTIKVSVQ